MSSIFQSSNPSISGGVQDPQSAIRKAARETGADFDYLLKTAKRESGLDPNARAQTSSATGLFQFTDDTWLRMVDRYGDKYGLSTQAENVSVSGGQVTLSEGADKQAILDLRKDSVFAARMAGELSNENATLLENRIDRKPTSKELYVAHFLGPKGAGDLINAASEDGAKIASEMFPRAARANPSIFKNPDGTQRNVAEVYANLTGSELSVSPDNTVVSSSGANAYFNAASDAARVTPLAPTSSMGGAIQLTSTVVMALLDLQDRHLDNERDQQNLNANSVNSSKA